MSPDESILRKILKGLKEVNLEAILVGNVACVLQGVPVMTQDIDFFVRDTELNKKKIGQFARNLNLRLYLPDQAVTEVIRAEGEEMVVDFVFRLAEKQGFETVRSKTKRIKIGDIFCKTLSLEDILTAKIAANREKDRLAIKFIQDTIRVKNSLKGERG